MGEAPNIKAMNIAIGITVLIFITKDIISILSYRSMHISKKLKLIVFDIDNTIHSVKDQNMPKHVLDILHFFCHNKVPIAIASLNQYAPQILKGYNIDHLFHSIEYRQHLSQCQTNDQIDEYYSLQKNKMFSRLSNTLNIKYNEMLFFDDTVINIIDAKELGINSIYVNPEKLITWTNVKEGISLLDKRKRRYSH